MWTLTHGDCFAHLAGLRVDHLVTDPPYSEATHGKTWVSSAAAASGLPGFASGHAGIGFGAISERDVDLLVAFAVGNVRRWSLVFCDLESAEMWRQKMIGVGLDYVRTCIWDKVDSTPQLSGDRPANAAEAIVVAHAPGKKRWNGGGQRNVFRVPVNGPEKGTKPHPTQKPLALMLQLVDLFTDPGELVCDPFAGAATTGVACVRRGRDFVGFEKDGEHYATGRDRLTAEENGISLSDARRGQEPLFRAG